MLKRRGPRGLFLKLEYTDLKISKQEKLNVWSAHIFTTYDNYDNNEWISFTYFSVVLQLLFFLCLCPFLSCELGSRWYRMLIALMAFAVGYRAYWADCSFSLTAVVFQPNIYMCRQNVVFQTSTVSGWITNSENSKLSILKGPSKALPSLSASLQAAFGRVKPATVKFSDGKEKPFEDYEDTNAISQNVLSSGSGSYYLITRLSSSGCCSKIPKHYDLRWSLDFTDRLSKHSFNYNLQWIAGKNCKDKNRSHVKNISKLASFFYARVTDDSRNKKQGESSSLFYDPKNINLFR